MIEQGVIKSDQVILVYSQPPEEALIGFVDSVNYPIVYTRIIPRTGSKNKFGKFQQIDISKDISLTILTSNFIKEYMTPKEKKYLKKIKKENEGVDLFAGEY